MPLEIAKKQKKGDFDMPKNIYTVSYYDAHVPMVRLTGKWLKENGINIGDKLKLIQSKNMIILAKLSDREINNLKMEQEIKELKQKLSYLKTINSLNE